MSRKTLVALHLYLAAFFAPILLIMAISGGLYLLGIKGNVTSGDPVQLNNIQLANDEHLREQQIRDVFMQVGLDADFEYLKGAGTRWQTRPTSRDHFIIEQQGNDLLITPRSPDLIASIVELHKGHGPGLFRILQQLLALGLVIVLLTGLWLGLKMASMKNQTLSFTAAGILLFVLFAAI
ncbi:PepSY-associated TM helix domain-containing protein [Bowmanella sp. JS7-9]|uniref:PepSY-associated TM helix domain-containing protein n=1 Tax=Pseudobowmanella zhangzhouensis TaxID=1537679 RepID=A0ABW1XKM2_9ALTE|nr:PepSY-associated TM helix domain-containing protein [Bowmanella sp. JS7-9]TBX27581.1 hypothetical protein TK45_00100 [Bowmanella sp. JS7-9]